MINNISDIEIINSINHGNKNDFKLLVDRYKLKAFSLLFRMLKNKEEAEEVLQDSFVKAFYSLPYFRSESKFSTWFYKIVYNTCLSHLSKQKRRAELELIIEDDNLLGNNDENILGTLEKSEGDIYKYIDLLPIKYSLILILFYIDELSISEISNALSITASNVKVILHRARTELKSILDKHNFKQVSNG